jgi:hypothetical protein
MQMSASIDGRIALGPSMTMFDEHPANDVLPSEDAGGPAARVGAGTGVRVLVAALRGRAPGRDVHARAMTGLAGRAYFLECGVDLATHVAERTEVRRTIRR